MFLRLLLCIIMHVDLIMFFPSLPLSNHPGSSYQFRFRRCFYPIESLSKVDMTYSQRIVHIAYFYWLYVVITMTVVLSKFIPRPYSAVPASQRLWGCCRRLGYVICTHRLHFLLRSLGGYKYKPACENEPLS